jgi:glutamate--cysteine ligase
MSLDPKLAPSPPLTTPAQLRLPFESAFRPKAAHKVGLEHENIGFLGTGPIPYGGHRGIEALLRRFGRFGLVPFLDGGKPIAMIDPSGLNLSLEPGGQFELAGTPHASLYDVAAEQARHHARVRALGAEAGVVLTSLGYRPFGTWRDAEWMPKARYVPMRDHLGAVDTHGLQMMTMTGTAQVNLDVSDEEDLGRKLRTAAGIGAIVSALCANSPLVDSQPSGFMSYRCRVWENVDRGRCGLLPLAFEPEPLPRYIEWALDAPMIFLRRESLYLPMRGLPFRHFMAEGFQGERAKASDWTDHLSTLFPDVRLKGVLEVRTADAAGADLAVALAALWKGVLYDADACAGADALTQGWSMEERLTFRSDVARQALEARRGASTARALAAELVALAKRGLVAQGCAAEAAMLDPMEEIARTGRTRAHAVLERMARGGPAAVIAGSAV